MKSRFRIPIRLKILITVLFVVTGVVSAITFTMANLFHQDKTTYIHDLTSIVAMSTAEESHSLLVGYSERLQAYARIIRDEEMDADRKTSLLEGFFQDFPELVGVSLYEQGEELATAYDSATLEQAGLTREQLDRFVEDHPLPLETIAQGDPYVVNSTISDTLPTLTLAVAPADGSEVVVSALVRLDALQRLSVRSEVFDVSIVAENGALLAHRESLRVAGRERIELQDSVKTLRDGHSAGLTLEYTEDDTEMIGGFARVGFGGVISAARIPKSTAYLASRNLLDNLLLVALGLLVVAAIVALAWAHKITRPVERLSRATREVAQGNFGIQVDVQSRDEIGSLAQSFNQMASELQDRDVELEQAHSQLIQSEKMAAFGQLGAGIAHEVKNPLAGILGCAQLSLRRVSEGDPLHKNLQLVERETKRCKHIIENLLKFARQEKAVLEPIEITGPIEDAAAIVQHQLEMSRIKLAVELPGQLPIIRGNANQLQQVLVNLMINAQQAMEGEPGSITLTASADAEHVEIVVSDTGPGIEEQNREKLFEPFFTTKPGGKGTGLGLSVSYGLVQDHGGDIQVSSEPGQGATFTISLPILPGAKVVEAKPQIA